MSRAARGEIWTVNFEPTIGSEITKTRPALIISVPNVGKLPLVIVVPLTDWKPMFADYVWFTHLPSSTENGLTKDSGADAFQVKSISELRLMRRLGRVNNPELRSIAAAVAPCIGYEHPSTYAK